ncbi:LPS assembly lipoprotein LptE [Dyella subtropica]|uniref:LPS-assembly lipoprotein LptE n=1 Tax=Dyella subtropica TaxID=2992127 RepID=UPI0022575FA3|nr:LPS assembly lipoprotein LptE [Dyella subtropica]
MSSVSRMFKASLMLASALALTACGFHLRQSAALPPSMQRMHLSVNGGGGLQRDLIRALEGSGVTVEDNPGAGIAELSIPVANFSTDTLTVSGTARVTEYAVHYQVQFLVNDGAGQPLLPQQTINMSRDFSYDATNTIGTTAQVQEIQRSLNDDMVQAILFRLQALQKHGGTVEPANASPAK